MNKTLVLTILLAFTIILLGCTAAPEERLYLNSSTACDSNQLNITFTIIDSNWIDQKPEGKAKIIITDENNNFVYAKDYNIKQENYVLYFVPPSDRNRYYYPITVKHEELTKILAKGKVYIYLSTEFEGRVLYSKTGATKHP